MQILLILLGCHIVQLMEGRVNAALNFALQLDDSFHLDWYLSGGIKNGGIKNGGIKNGGINHITEADKMERMITNNTQSNWSFIIDVAATNTAENFLQIADTIGTYDGVYVVTSAFHQERASKIMDGIIPGNNAKWILSELEMPDSRYWEKIHMKNVDADVKKALLKKTVL
jgi:hypothetical protein